MDYARPRRLEEALALLAGRERLVLAGGTDVYPASVGRPLAGPVLDIGGLTELGGIEADREGWRIGALARWSDLMAADLPPLFDGLRAAAAEVGGRQIQNAGTLAGNLCTASPAGDGIPNLLALDATVELASLAGRRVLPVGAFVLGNRRTARRADELVTTIRVPRPEGQAHSLFLKLGARRHLVISIVMVALVISVRQGRIVQARIAVGACAPTARRLEELERRLIGRTMGDDLPALVDEGCLAPLAPIDDIRATAAYRRDACLTLLRRGLAALG